MRRSFQAKEWFVFQGRGWYAGATTLQVKDAAMRVRKIKTVACLGTGVMGHGVAFLAARAGMMFAFTGLPRKGLRRGAGAIADRVFESGPR
jgi:hypothetical protein